MSRTRLHDLSNTAPTLFQASTHLARRLCSGNGAAAIAALALAILFVLLLHIYAKRFLQPSSSTGDTTSLNPTVVLDDSTVSSLPCFVYDPSEHRNQYGSECVVCLSELEESDEVIVLPQCGHYFHMECIDMWLRSHSNCPICRTTIDVVEESDGGEIGKGLMVCS